MRREIVRIMGFILLLPGLLLAQATLRGRITDQESGQALPGANIQVQGTLRGAVADANGRYPAPIPGQWSEI
jgi:iron complex outermembrane receptor protein